MVSQMVGRQTFPTQNKAIPTALGGFGAINTGTDDRSSVSSIPQGFTNGTNSWRPSNNIWGNGTLSTGFVSAQRESARGAENGTYRKSATEVIEGKTGSGSLVASSETDTWSNQRSPWNNPDPSSQPAQQRRASSVSPVSQIPSSQPYVESAQPTSQRFVPSRSVMMGQGFASKSSSRPVLDPTSGHFVARRPADHAYNDYGRIVELDTATQRSDSMRPWTDGPNIQSPTDDRRSIGNSEYFSSSSAAQSRSGSLPPSRQGSDPVQFQLPTDFPQYTKMQAPAAGRGQTTSLSTHANSRHAERNDSVASDMIPAFSRMSVDNGVSDQAMLIHKSYLGSTNGHNSFPAASSQSSVSRQALADISHNVLNHEEINLNGHGSFTPDGYPGQYADPLAHFRGLQFGNRGTITPNGEFRPGQYYSTGGTLPMFDPLYPSRSDQNIRPHSNGHSTLLDRKLRSVQQEQSYLHAQYQHMIAQAQQFRFPFDPYAFEMAPSMSLNGIAPALTMAPMHGIMPALDPPRGPREQEPGTGFRSALLDEFKHNGRNKRYELKDIYDHICEFSGDQHGSRFIQQKLETANSDEKERVFKEIHPNAMQLMTDVFGNYVIQKFFEHGDQNQKKILANRMKGSVLSLTVQMYGCRVVQKALEHVLVDQQAAIVKELEGSVVRCVKDQNGNHVIQKAIERVPAQHVQFIVDAFEGHVASLSTHGYGCRVIQRLLEFGEPSCQRTVLSELHTAALTLIPDPYGNYVTQHIIEHGEPEDRAKMIGLVTSQLLAFAKHKFASNVVEKCLIYGDDKQRRDIMFKTVEKNERGESSLVSLIKDAFGNYVIQKILDTLNASDYLTFLEYLQPELLKAKRTVAGKHVQAIESKLHRLDGAETVHETLQHNASGTESTSGPITQNVMANTQPKNALMRPEANAQYMAMGAATPRTNTY